MCMLLNLKELLPRNTDNKLDVNNILVKEVVYSFYSHWVARVSHIFL